MKLYILCTTNFIRKLYFIKNFSTYIIVTYFKTEHTFKYLKKYISVYCLHEFLSYFSNFGISFSRFCMFRKSSRDLEDHNFSKISGEIPDTFYRDRYDDTCGFDDIINVRVYHQSGE